MFSKRIASFYVTTTLPCTYWKVGEKERQGFGFVSAIGFVEFLHSDRFLGISKNLIKTFYQLGRQLREKKPVV